VEKIMSQKKYSIYWLQGYEHGFSGKQPQIDNVFSMVHILETIDKLDYARGYRIGKRDRYAPPHLRVK
jgi:hypothetical protein